MQNAISFKAAFMSGTDTDTKSGTTQFGNAKKQMDTGFSSIMNREIDKASDSFEAKRTPERKPKEINKIPDENAAYAMTGQTEKRIDNDYQIPKDENGYAEAAGDSGTEVYDKDVTTQNAKDFKPVMQMLAELLKEIKTPEAQEYFNNLNSDGNTEIDIEQLVAELTKLAETDEQQPDFQKLLSDMLDKINAQLGNLTSGEEQNIVLKPDYTAETENITGIIDTGKTNAADVINTADSAAEDAAVSAETQTLSVNPPETGVNTQDTEKTEPEVKTAAPETIKVQTNPETNKQEAPEIKAQDITQTAETAETAEIDSDAASVMEFGAKISKIVSQLKNTESAANQDSQENSDTPENEIKSAPVIKPAEDTDTEESGAQKQNGERHGESDKKPIITNTADNSPVFAHNVAKSENVRIAEPPVQPPPVDVRAVINQIVESMKFDSAGDASKVEINLAPEFLGKLSVILTSTPDGMTASIKAANDSVRTALTANILELENSLKASGINMKSISVTSEQLSWDFARGQNTGGEFSRQGKFGENLKDNGKNHKPHNGGGKIINIHNNYNIDRISQMSQPLSSLTGSVEFLA